MMHKVIGILTIVILALVAFGLPVSAQDGTLASELNYPRQIAYHADGNLYIAEAGYGGAIEMEIEDPASGQMVPASAGLTARVVMV
ncbi:MAG: hypothetical protein GYB65_04825, partial [Chloroflexi bacterium]|nr:hypothetical protein [Chloroflexota bacterium]